MQHHHLKQLRQLKLSGMAHALEQQWESPNTYGELSFDERFELLVSQEVTARANSRLQRLVKSARFKVAAQMHDIDYAHPRGLKQAQMASLQSGDWINHHQNLAITGPTGCGKTYLACALGNNACHQDKMYVTIEPPASSKC